MTRSVLIVAVEPRIRKELSKLLGERFGSKEMRLLEADCVEQALDLVIRCVPDLIIAADDLPIRRGDCVGPYGSRLVSAFNNFHTSTIFFGHSDPPVAQISEAMQAGLAQAYLVVHRTPPELWWRTVERVLKLPAKNVLILGESPAMIRLKQELAIIAPGNMPVLIRGEPGTGKSLVAFYLHQHSLRQNGPFVHASCATFCEGLVESELFGHVCGAFTGATKNRLGLFQQANKGTLFLDEIGDLPLSQQSRLLVPLDTNTIRPVGSDKEVNVDVRIIAATNKNLEQCIESGIFRLDLYHRLEEEIITVPPLRKRGQDILLLADSIIAEFCYKEGITYPVTIFSELQERMLRYSWPGNVRKLETLLKRAIRRTTSTSPCITELGWSDGEPPSTTDFFKEFLELQKRGLNNQAIANRMGISRSTLYRHLKMSQSITDGE